MHCPSCGTENPTGTNFCEECGAQLARLCPSCSHELRPTAKFCGNCGAALSQQSSVQSLESRILKDSVPSTLDPRRQPLDTAAERRQLTVMFCDLVGSTALSTQLDPEDYHTVVQRYHQTCEAVIQRYDGFVPQHLGDGLLVYFGYPTAHEDDAQRALRTALDIVEAIRGLSFSTIQLPHPLQVRIGIHTGLVVIGEIGSSEKREMLALGETPNLAARVQGVAEPNTVAMSAVTHRLVQGLFECQELGPQELKGFATPVAVYRVIGESTAQNRFEAEVNKGLTPLVGRELEVGLLRERWERVKAGAGQVVLLSGEPGIGKSRLVQVLRTRGQNLPVLSTLFVLTSTYRTVLGFCLMVLKEQVTQERATRVQLRCAAYHQHSAYHPILEHLQRLLGLTAHDSAQSKLEKLRQTLAGYRFPQPETLSLLAAFLSLPHPEQVPPLSMSPQKQKEKTQAAIVAWLVEEAERALVYCVWEDVHWADPSTLEVLTLLVAQVPATRLLVLATCRPEFTPPWGSHSYLTQLTLSRLSHAQVEAMVAEVAADTLLPAEVIEQIQRKTDGVPLFVEELTKMVLESGFDGGAQPAASLQLAIPATLQDALRARLDRLAPVREIAQMGAVLGREFSYELLQALSPLTEERLQQGLGQLVETELVYQRGLPPQAIYTFKHALIQDTAYQSLLKSRRQQLHLQIAQILPERFPATQETQPELLAHHYTEAGLVAQAIPYWQKAGQRAAQRSANAEAENHLQTALRLLATLPDTLERAQQELTLQIALSSALAATKGYGASEVENAYIRARELCRQLGETPQLFSVLRGLTIFYGVRAEHRTARELAEACLHLARNTRDPAFLIEAHYALGNNFFYLGEFALAREHFEQCLALYDPQQHHTSAFLYGQDTGIACAFRASWVFHLLGYPDQALKLNRETMALAKELSHFHSLAYALNSAASLYQYRQENQAAQEQADEAITLSTERGFLLWVAWGSMIRGWALAGQGRGTEGVRQIREGLATFQATGAETSRHYILALLAEALGKAGQIEEGLSRLDEALAMVNKTGERFYEAELYRLKGELLLAQARELGD